MGPSFENALPKSLIELVTSLGAPGREVRLDALRALIDAPVPTIAPMIVPVLSDPDPAVRRLASLALAACEGPSAQAS